MAMYQTTLVNWIPADKELPEPGDLVLVTTKNRRVFILQRQRWCDPRREKRQIVDRREPVQPSYSYLSDSDSVA